MKKFKITFLGIASLAAVTALASCSTSTEESLDSDLRMLLAQESISAMNTLDSSTEEVVVETTEEEETTEETTVEEETTEEATEETTEEAEEEASAYTVNMEEVNNLIQRANVLAENKLSITVEESDREGYIEKQIITYGDQEYILYIASKEAVEKMNKQARQLGNNSFNGEAPSDMTGGMQAQGGMGGFQGQMNGQMEMPSDMSGGFQGQMNGQMEMPSDMSGSFQAQGDTSGLMEMPSDMTGGFQESGEMSGNMELPEDLATEEAVAQNSDSETIKYAGIIIFEGNEYEFVAKEETKETEESSKNKLKLVVTLDEENEIIIKAKDEVENGETETKFSCKYVTNGEVTNEFYVKTETEDGEKKIKIRENGVHYRLKYYTEDGVDYLKLYVKDTYKVLLSITVDEEGNTVYTVVEAE